MQTDNQTGLEEKMERLGSEDKYELVEKLGEGTYGVVYKCKDKQNSQKVLAIKKIRMDNQEEGIPSTALREITLVKQLAHPNVITIQQVHYQENTLEIVFDFVDQDLKQYMHSFYN